MIFLAITVNLLLGRPEAIEAEIHQVCKICQVDEFIESFLFEYDTPLEDNGANLSERATPMTCHC